MKKWWIETRDPNQQKVCLRLYREESKKIFQIIERFAKCVEKAGCDEAFLDVTEEVNKQNENAKDINYEIGLGTKDFWEGAYFMSFSKNKQTGISGGTFIAETIHE